MFIKETNGNEKLIVRKYVSWYIWYYSINSLKVLDNEFEMLLINSLFFSDSYRGINNQLLLFKILLSKYKKVL